MVNHTTSTNIIRDAVHDIQYILTPNSLNVFQRITKGFKSGQHSFNIIGSYGTGKSSFLWALEKNLRDNSKPIFEPLNGHFNGLKKFKFIKLIGEPCSFIEVFNSRIGIAATSSPKEAIEALDAKQKKANEEGAVLLLIVDEFGKFLEYASKNDPDKELYFIQQIAEYVNDSSKDILFLVTLHQNFGAYSRSLTKDQKQEWEKVKGRLIDVAFDEPIEQLLFLASERLQGLKSNSPSKKYPDELFRMINQSKLLSNSSNLDKKLADKLYPMDYLSANILARALQKYGQNERSLFTFLASSELRIFAEAPEGGVFSLTHVFDYLTKYMSIELEDRDANPHKPVWQSIYNALDKTEAINETEVEALTKLIKCIGLVNIFGKALGGFGQKELKTYAKLSLGIPNADALIKRLTQQKIIKYYSFKKKLFFLDGTDIDFEQELLEATGKVAPIGDVTQAIRYYVPLPMIVAKRIQYEKGTPRFFQFRLIGETKLMEGVLTAPENEIDGYINLIFSDGKIKTKVLEQSKQHNCAQVFVQYHSVEKLKSALFEVNKIDYVLGKAGDDKVAQKILLEERGFQVSHIKSIISEGLYGEDASWYYKGEPIDVCSYKDLNKLISGIANDAYPGTPHLLNEMINKEDVSCPVRTARKALIKDLVTNIGLKELGYSKDKYPPQKTMYRSLVKDTGMHRESDGQWYLDKPQKKEWEPLWDTTEAFLQEAKIQKKNLSEFYSILKLAPFKLKQGLVDCWVPIVLLTKKEDIALFHIDNGYIPYLTSEVLDLIHKKPKDFLIKSYSVSGVKNDLYLKYRELASVANEKLGKRSSFITIFSQFMNFYMQLPKYNKDTKKLTKKTLAFRDAIKNAKDPEEALFDEFPKALGLEVNLQKDTNALGLFMDQIKESINEIRSVFSGLLDRIENVLIEAVGMKKASFAAYKLDIQEKYKSIDPNLLIPQQKTFYMRIMSPLDERDSWLQSICDVLIKKNINELKDDEEPLLLKRLKETFHDLGKLLDIHALRSGERTGEVIHFEILSADGDKKADYIKINAKYAEKVDKLEKRLLGLLGREKDINKAALLRIIAKQLENQ